MNYIYPIKWAIIVFPFLSILFTLPYIISQYHKYGSISFFKTIVVYAFILYLTTIYFLAILPLPSIESVKSLTTIKMQLIPFTFIIDFIKHTEFVWNNPATYLKVFIEPEFYQIFFNILMF